MWPSFIGVSLAPPPGRATPETGAWAPLFSPEADEEAEALAELCEGKFAGPAGTPKLLGSCGEEKDGKWGEKDGEGEKHGKREGKE